jgi:hypothetical protein
METPVIQHSFMISCAQRMACLESPSRLVSFTVTAGYGQKWPLNNHLAEDMEPHAPCRPQW